MKIEEIKSIQSKLTTATVKQDDEERIILLSKNEVLTKLGLTEYIKEEDEVIELHATIVGKEYTVY